MTPDRPFEVIKYELQSLLGDGDTEIHHVEADKILMEIALCVHLTTQERYDLVKIYNKVPKWFA
jgi:hypothetical protein